MAQTQVDTARVTFGEMVAAAGGLALIVVMLLPWFSVDAPGAIGLEGNAWEALGFIDVVIFFAAVAVIAIAVVKAAEPAALQELPWPPANIALGAGGIAALLILFRLLSPPELEIGDFTAFDLETNREIGVVLGLVAALGMLLGGWLQQREAAQSAAADSAAAGTAPAAGAAAPDELAGGEAGGTQGVE